MHELDVVRVTQLKVQRPVDGTAGATRPPRVGDVGIIVCVLGEHRLMVECVDTAGATVWLAAFSPSGGPFGEFDADELAIEPLGR